MANVNKDKRVEDIAKVQANPQGGKSFGNNLKTLEQKLDQIAKNYKESNPEADVDEIEKVKRKFIKYDSDLSGDINVDELMYMFQDLGQPKNRLECEKVIKQNDKHGTGTIDFQDFLEMLLGKSANLFLKRLLFFKELEKQSQAQSQPQNQKKK
jgi:hypothetical protein